MGIRSYTVHQPADAPSERIDRAVALKFVRDGVSWAALFIAPLWLAINGAWLGLLGYGGVVALLVAAVKLVGLPPALAVLGIIAMHVAVALEAASLRRWSLDRAGWRTLGAVSARSQDEAERRFFDAWLPAQAALDRSGMGERRPGGLATS